MSDDLTMHPLYKEEKVVEPISAQFWFSLGVVTGAAVKTDSTVMKHVLIVYRELADRYPEMAPLRKYLPEEPKKK